MPKYVEEREVMPVPGAFGVTMALSDWIRAHRADADFYNGDGRYKHCLRIYLEEEYGYREWLWTYPGTAEELVEDWAAGNRPLAPRYQGRGWSRPGWRPDYRGDFDEITWRPNYCRQRPDPWIVEHLGDYTMGTGRRETSIYPLLIQTGYPVLCIEGRDGFDGTAHVHEDEDSVLNVSYFRVRGLHNPEVEIVPHMVLEEMSKLAKLSA